MKTRMRTGTLVLLFFFLISSYGPASRSGASPKAAGGQDEHAALPGRYETYADRWLAVKGFDEKGKPRSALEAVESILALAKKSSNAPQIVKAQVHRVRYIMAIGEKEHPEVLRMLESETAAAHFPEKQILSSLLAEAYWSYFNANRYAFYNRTRTVNLKEDDVSTWSLGRVMGRIVELYRESVAGADNLKKAPLGLMEDILVPGNAPRACRPTLYDFLAHRAVDFFMTDENQLTKPVYDFEIDSAGYFGTAEEFSKMKVTAKDASSLRYNAVLMLQELTRFHLDDAGGPASLVDVELKRLQFVRDAAIVPDRDDRYIDALQKLEKRYAKDPASGPASYEIALWYRARGNEWKEGDPSDHRWSLTKSAEIARGVMARFPDSEGALMCRPLTTIDKELSLMTEKVTVPGRPFRALVKYRNINRVHLAAVRLSPQMYEYLNTGYDTTGDKIAKLVKIKPLHEWSVALPDDGDLRGHAAEVKVPSLEIGQYAVLAGTDPSFSHVKNAVAYMSVTVSGLGFVHRLSGKEGAVCYVFGRETGEPLKNVKATITERKYDYTKSAYVTRTAAVLSTDENGCAVYPIRGDFYNGTMTITLARNGDTLSTEFYSHAYDPRGSDTYQTHFFTDRSIYRPGQTIYFKAILLQLDRERHCTILPDRDTIVALYDVNQQKVGEVALRSNRYGTVSGSFTAPSGALTGAMTIRNDSGSSVVRVEEYKRPRFEAGFEPVKGNYRLGDTVRAKGFARSYAGAVLSDAAVKYTVVRKVWFLYRWRGWYYRNFNGQQTVIQKGETKTDAGGGFTVDFTAVPDRRIPRSEQPAFYYEVHADVTDINGETHGADTQVRAGYTALIVDIANLPQSVDSTKKLELELSTLNFSGEFVAAKGTLSVSRLREPERLLRNRLWEKPDRFVMSKDEYVENFPHDIYNDEDDASIRGIDKKVYAAAFNTAKNKTIVPDAVGSWQDGEYLVEVETKDAYGEKIRFQRGISVYSSAEGRFARMTYLYLTPVTDTVEPGGEARLLAGSAARGAYLLLDIIRQGVNTEKRMVKLDGNKKLIRFPVREEDRGNIQYRYALVRDGRLVTGAGAIVVPWTNKQLKAEFMTFRDRLSPGEKEEWRIKITGPGGEFAAAELAAAMYDASLDSFSPHYWYFNINPSYYNYNFWHTNSTYSVEQSRIDSEGWNEYYPGYSRTHDRLNLFGLYFYSRGKTYRYRSSGGGRGTKGYAAADDFEEGAADTKKAEPESEKRSDEPAPAPSGDTGKARPEEQKKISGDGSVQVRKNLNETAFFYPHLATSEKGEVIISFTAPGALTRWKILGLAHTTDLKSVVFTNELVTQKDVMVTPNVPRFLREGDRVVISAKISNMTEGEISGEAELLLFDAVTMKPLDRELGNERSRIDFTAPAKGNTAVSWNIRVPDSLEAVTWRVTARAGNIGDGEESTLPVLSNRMLVTESLPLPVRGKQAKTFSFKKLLDSKASESLSHYRLTLEFTSNPAWYAVQALPYLMEFPHECSEQVFSRFYANGLATRIVNAGPAIRSVFEKWKGSGALLSNLQKNEELKSVLLQETPWLLNGRSEEESKKRVAQFFELGRMAGELEKARSKLVEMQGANGGWPWFPGLPESWYITQHILAGLAKLVVLGVESASKERTAGVTKKAVSFIDGEMKAQYDYLVKNKISLKQKNIGLIIYHYLYTRSFFKEIPISASNKKAFNYWKDQAVKYWPDEGPYGKGLAAIGLFRYGEVKAAGRIMESLRETAIRSEELGMYWKENVGGYWWYQAPTETQALLIEAFGEVARDSARVDDMRTWLLKSKQVQHWSTTKATTDACYAILMGGSDWLAGRQAVEIFLGNVKVDPTAMGARAEAGTGYFKVSWNRDRIDPAMGAVKVVNRNSGPAWGALYWQYFERLDRITPHETPLKLEKKFFLVRSTDTGPELDPVTDGMKLKPGDRLMVRIILRSDRDMDYLHMKDLRAAGTEPENVLSGHRYQDGLWYYESTRDTATHFFIERLPKGTYVFEYPLMVNLKGDFSAGITTIQCMYAPEFTSHSEGTRLRVE